MVVAVVVVVVELHTGHLNFRTIRTIRTAEAARDRVVVGAFRRFDKATVTPRSTTAVHMLGSPVAGWLAVAAVVRIRSYSRSAVVQAEEVGHQET